MKHFRIKLLFEITDGPLFIFRLILRKPQKRIKKHPNNESFSRFDKNMSFENILLGWGWGERGVGGGGLIFTSLKRPKCTKSTKNKLKTKNWKFSFRYWKMWINPIWRDWFRKWHYFFSFTAPKELKWTKSTRKLNKKLKSLHSELDKNTLWCTYTLPGGWFWKCH